LIKKKLEHEIDCNLYATLNLFIHTNHSRSCVCWLDYIVDCPVINLYRKKCLGQQHMN